MINEKKMTRNKTTGIKMVNGENGIFENNTFENIDTSFDITSGKNNTFLGNKITKSKESRTIKIIDWALGIIGTIIAGLILYSFK